MPRSVLQKGQYLRRSMLSELSNYRVCEQKVLYMRCLSGGPNNPAAFIQSSTTKGSKCLHLSSFISSVEKDMEFFTESHSIKGGFSGPNNMGVRRFCTTAPDPDPTRLLRELCGRIKLMGPLTMADYMREVLVNPRLGYYMSGEVLGEKGDFVTSPEISQMFGECLGIWVLSEWQKMGHPAPMQLVELGPGKGTLMSDILRTIGQLSPESLTNISVHLVELSPSMRREQELALGSDEDTNTSKFGPSLHWYESLLDVPRGFSFFLAHEFFDALPVHKLQRTPDGWREILIDINPDSETPMLRYVLSRHSTPACSYVAPDERRHHVEVCPSVGVLARDLSARIHREGGAALVADYGHEGQMEDTLRAFRKHRQVDPLELPGSADLTADVDFKYMQYHITDGTEWWGPVEQGKFLHSLGIKMRCQQLVRSTKDDKMSQEIIAGYDTLTNPDKMGARFKFAAIFPKTMKPIHDKYPPVGFQQE